MTNLETLETAALADKRTEHTARAHGLVCIWDGEFEYYRAADFDAGVFEPLARSIAAELADGGILVSPAGGNAELRTPHLIAHLIVTKAQEAHGGLFRENVARAMVDALSGPRGVAYVSFDVNGHAFEASPYHPGSWLAKTILYRVDGSSERVI